jgi:mannose-1-phosphate guanylyltransferase/mannose-6-phosphate isomerase
MISREDPEALMAVLPADHVIPDGRAFATAIRRAAAAAATGVLVTLGVRPSRPDSSYGYIHAGVPAAGGFPGLYRVRRFVEKPDAARARRYLRQKGVFWNAGIFVWGAETILGEMERLAPDVHRCLSFLRDARTRERRGALERAYRHAPSLPIDVAVVERSRKVWVLPVDFHWSDVGTWASLAQELGVASGVTRVLDGDVMLDDAGGNLVWADGRLVVLLGVEGLAVVDSGDALLVTRLERSGEVRRVVERLRRRGRAELT